MADNEMFIHYYMTQEPLVIAAEMPISEARELLHRHSFRHLPVVNKDTTLCGMITDRDLRSACPSTLLHENERNRVLAKVRTTPVSAIMAKHFFSLRTNSTLDDALLLFSSHSIGALPVIDESNRVQGIFSLNDMMSAYQNLFGLGEKGSMLVAIQDTGEADLLGRLVSALDNAHISCTRLVRSTATDKRQPNAIYLRVNTYKLSSVHAVIHSLGCTMLAPDGSLKGDS